MAGRVPCCRRPGVKSLCCLSLLAVILYVGLIVGYVSRSLAMLEALEEWKRHPRVGEPNFFFTETTCWSGGGGGVSSWFRRPRGPNPRQACSVEAAARAHPSHNVYLLVTCVSDLWPGPGTPPHVQALSAYPNVRPMFLDIDRLVEDTAVEQWWRTGAMASSVWPVAHSSDLVRLLVLFKYGGVYADLDVLVLRNLSGLGNFVPFETQWSLGSAVLGLGATGDGHQIAGECLREFAAGFAGDEWVRQGPDVLRRMLCRRCNVSEVSELRAECLGSVSLQQAAVFNPVHYSQVRKLFGPTNAEPSLIRMLTRPDGLVRAVHLWNDISAGMTVSKSAGQVYGRLAAAFCPRVYDSTGDLF